MDPRTYIFKIKYGDTLRRISVGSFDIFRDKSPDMTFSQLQSIIREGFQIPAASTVSIVYTDRDNDEVAMVDDSDIRDACVHQKLNPVRVTVLPHAPPPPSPSPSAFAADPPPWAADILLKLDQILVAVNKPPLVEPGVIVAPASPVSTKTDDHVLEIVDPPLDGSTIQPARDVFHSEQFDSAQSGIDSEFLRRAAILRQRVMTDDLQQSSSD